AGARQHLARSLRDRKVGCERDRTGNSRGAGNQRFGEFCPEMTGCERDLRGPYRTPDDLPRNRERRPKRRLDVNPWKKGGKTRNAGRGASRRLLVTSGPRKFADPSNAPRMIGFRADHRRLGRETLW